MSQINDEQSKDLSQRNDNNPNHDRMKSNISQDNELSQESKEKILSSFLRFNRYIANKEIENTKELEEQKTEQKRGKINKEVSLVEKMNALDKKKIERNTQYFINGKKIKQITDMKKLGKKNILMQNISIQPNKNDMVFGKEITYQMKQMPLDIDMLLKDKMERKRGNDEEYTDDGFMSGSTTTGNGETTTDGKDCVVF
jgi:hypothetical protein